MTKDQQEKFTVLNEAWTTIEPLVKDKQPYKDIMGTLFKMFYKKRNNAVFSDEWWQEVVDEFLRFPERYDVTRYFEFAGNLAMGFLNYWEHTSKSKAEIEFFKRDVEEAFVKEKAILSKLVNN